MSKRDYLAYKATESVVILISVITLVVSALLIIFFGKYSLKILLPASLEQLYNQLYMDYGALAIVIFVALAGGSIFMLAYIAKIIVFRMK